VSDIIREVDEELRRENWEKLWKSYGKYVVGAAVGIVLVTAGIVGWREYSQYRNRQAGDAFAAVVAQTETADDPAAAASDLEAYAESAPTGYATLARFREARYRALNGDKAGAAALYDELAADGGVEPLFQDLAKLYSVRLQIGEADAATLTTRLEPLTADDNVWRYSARELKAIITLQAGDREEARKAYAQLADDLSAPQQQRARAAEMLRAIGP